MLSKFFTMSMGGMGGIEELPKRFWNIGGIRLNALFVSSLLLQRESVASVAMLIIHFLTSSVIQA